MIRFGVAGCLSKNISETLHLLHEKRIEYYEIGFQYGIPETLPKALLDMSEELNIKLSCHLPFFINFGNKEKVEKSTEYLVNGFKVAEMLKSIAVFHLGYYGKRKFESIKDDVLTVLEGILDEYCFENAKLGIETTGKKKAIGTLNEVLTICKDMNRREIIPVIDWSHIYARHNGWYPRTTNDFRDTILRITKHLGLRNLYCHGGGIKYNKGNEKKHITARSCEPPLPYLLSELRELNCDSVLIIESPTSTEDASWLREVYRSPESWLEFTRNQLEKGTVTLDKFF